MIRRPSLLSAVAVALALAASAIRAAPSSFDNPSGTRATFSYSNGQSDNGLFGSPVVNDQGFIFAPEGLVAEASSGFNLFIVAGPNLSNQQASDTVSIILNAKPNTTFKRIGARLNGDYFASGFAGIDTNATLRIFNLDDANASPITTPLAFSPSFPQMSLTGPIGDQFAATTPPGDVLPAGWRNIRVEFSDFVSAGAVLGNSAIQTKGANIDVETASIPVPAAIAVAPLLGAIAWKARRKFAR